MTQLSPHLLIIANDAFSLINFRGPLISTIVGMGWQVSAMAPNYTEDIRARIQALGATPVDYPLSRAGMNPFGDLATLLNLRRQIRRLRPDRVFAFAIKPVIYGTLAARLSGVERTFGLVAGLGYGLAASEGTGLRQSLAGLVTRLLARLAMAVAERVFFQNGDDLDDLVKWRVLERSKGVVVGATGVDTGVWRPAPIPDGPAVFLLMARMVREKGIVEFAEAAARLHSEFPDTRFLLIGGLDSNPNGLDRKAIEGWKHVEWHGHVDNVRDWLTRASVFVLPSFYREGVPRSTQEAMALGRPVITTDWPGCRETVVHEENGLLIPVRDVDALEAAMRRFIIDPGLASRLGARSRQLALERFDVHQTNARMIEAMKIDRVH